MKIDLEQLVQWLRKDCEDHNPSEVCDRCFERRQVASELESNHLTPGPKNSGVESAELAGYRRGLFEALEVVSTSLILSQDESGVRSKSSMALSRVRDHIQALIRE